MFDKERLCYLFITFFAFFVNPGNTRPSLRRHDLDGYSRESLIQLLASLDDEYVKEKHDNEGINSEIEHLLGNSQPEEKARNEKRQSKF